MTHLSIICTTLRHSGKQFYYSVDVIPWVSYNKLVMGIININKYLFTRLPNHDNQLL